MKEFPGDPVVKTLPFQCRGCGFDPDQETRIPQIEWVAGQKEKKKLKWELKLYLIFPCWQKSLKFYMINL